MICFSVRMLVLLVNRVFLVYFQSTRMPFYTYLKVEHWLGVYLLLLLDEVALILENHVWPVELPVPQTAQIVFL